MAYLDDELQEYIKKSETALLVVDPQNDILVEKGYLNFWGVWKHARENNSINNIKSIVKSAREKNIPVIWFVTEQLAGERGVYPGTYVGDFMNTVRSQIPDAWAPNTWESEIYDELAELIEPHDPVLSKLGSGTFEGTSLLKYLNYFGIKVLLTTGYLTDFCVEATVRTASDRGYLPVTVSDACAAQNETFHQESLKRMEKMSGPVINTKEALSLLENHKKPLLSTEKQDSSIEERAKKFSQGKPLNEILTWQDYLNIEKTALIIVDPQNAYLSEQGSLAYKGYWEQAQKNGALNNLKTLVDSCREHGISIIWAKQSHNVKNLYRRDSWSAKDTEFHPEVSNLVNENDLIIEKPGFNAFEGTTLEINLNTMGINSVIVCGFPSELGVESTVRATYDYGYLPVVISDATASVNQEEQSQALNRFGRLIGFVETTENFLNVVVEQSKSKMPNR